MPDQIKLTIYLDAPLLLGDVTSGDENSNRSLDHISGAALRGLVVGAFQRSKLGKNISDLGHRSVGSQIVF